MYDDAKDDVNDDEESYMNDDMKVRAKDASKTQTIKIRARREKFKLRVKRNLEACRNAAHC